MGAVGFLNLPSWHPLLRQSLVEAHLAELLRAPVLGNEEVEPPWTSLEPEGFFPIVETGFHFPDHRPPGQWPQQVVTADPLTALARLKEGERCRTGIRGAIGGTYPVLDVFHPRSGYPPPRRLLAMPDGIAGAVLSEMERSGKPWEAAAQEIQWRNSVPGNLTRHLHGLVARERLALLGSMVFGVVIDPEGIAVEGFGRVEPRDLQMARHFNLTIRLVAVVEDLGQGLTAWVRPLLIPARYLLAQVRGGAEAAYLQMADQSSFFFSGSGTDPEVTLRGMLRDWKELGAMDPASCPAFRPAALIPSEQVAGGFYLRFGLLDFDRTVAQILNLLSAKGIGIMALHQPEALAELPAGHAEPELVVFTRPVTESLLQEALREIRESVRLASLKAGFRYEG